MDIQNIGRELSQIDIAKIDVGKLSQSLKQRKDILLNIAIVVATFLLAGNIFENLKVQEAKLRSDISGFATKNDAIKNYEKSRKNLDDLLASFPSGFSDAGQMMDKINEFAILHSIQISSFTPKDGQQTDFYDTVGIQLSASAASYENIAFFIRDIENSPYGLRIEHWATELDSRYTTNTGDSEPGSVKISITIESVKLRK
ncbi:MAG: type 4a pilus biogenesis protein PilO [Candidatus Omnitrophota bacterium]